MRGPPESVITPLPQVNRQTLKGVPNWLSEDEGHNILETVVLNVGISQQLFDVHAFSDHFSFLYQESNADVYVPRLWLVEALLVFAIGRLLQARVDDI
jgi:proline utilization trans-activator